MSSPTCGEWLVSKEVMKAKTLNFLCGLSLLSLGLWSCSETNYPVYPDCIEARVIDNVCGQAVIEILSSPYHHLGEDNFLASDGNTYNNVFSTTLDCEEIDSAKGRNILFQAHRRPGSAKLYFLPGLAFQNARSLAGNGNCGGLPRDQF